MLVGAILTFFLPETKREHYDEYPEQRVFYTDKFVNYILK